jgi:ABC-type antimicrobial peptide transport system permease subunit
MNLASVTPGYFQALGIPIKRGREFDEVDASGETPVAVISEMLARQIAADRDLLGTRLVLSVPTAGGKRVRPTVVGISSDVKFVGLEAPTEANTYVPWRQLPTGVSYLVVRASRDTEALAPVLRRVIHDLDPTLPVPVVRSLGEEVSLAMASRTLRLRLVSAFAVLALLVSLVGLASALSRSVVERHREIAIRLALGSTRGGAAGLVVGEGARLIVLGLAVGAGAALAVGRLMATLLFGVSAYDPLTYVTVFASVLAIGLAACYLPARRAAGVDPIALLKSN